LNRLAERACFSQATIFELQTTRRDLANANASLASKRGLNAELKTEVAPCPRLCLMILSSLIIWRVVWRVV
jgi:hypothetical protein